MSPSPYNCVFLEVLRSFKLQRWATFFFFDLPSQHLFSSMSLGPSSSSSLSSSSTDWSKQAAFCPLCFRLHFHFLFRFLWLLLRRKWRHHLGTWRGREGRSGNSGQRTWPLVWETTTGSPWSWTYCRTPLTDPRTRNLHTTHHIGSPQNASSGGGGGGEWGATSVRCYSGQLLLATVSYFKGFLDFLK